VPCSFSFLCFRVTRPHRCGSNFYRTLPSRRSLSRSSSRTRFAADLYPRGV
jgi:hypothetical protein